MCSHFLQLSTSGHVQNAILEPFWLRKVPKHTKTGPAPHLTMDW